MKTICVYSEASWILKASVFLRIHTWCLVTARSCSRWCARCLCICVCVCVCVCVSVYTHFSSIEYRWERTRWDRRMTTRVQAQPAISWEGHTKLALKVYWDGWMASPTQCTWILVNSGCWWWTKRSSMVQFMGLQRVRHDWVTELNWTMSNWLPWWLRG